MDSAMSLTPAQRSLRARIASAEKWAATGDRSAATAPARKAFNDRFIRDARDRFGDLPEAELLQRAEQLRRAYFARLALKSSRARSRARELTAEAEAADAELAEMGGLAS